jgi:hypothetical protein
VCVALLPQPFVAQKDGGAVVMVAARQRRPAMVVCVAREAAAMSLVTTCAVDPL